MIRKVWHLICLVFLGYCIHILLDKERYEVNYGLSKKNETVHESKKIHYLYCLNISKFLKSKNITSSDIELNDLSYIFYDHFKNSDRLKLSTEKQMPNEDRLFILKLIKSKKHLVIKGLFCLVSNEFRSNFVRFKDYKVFQLDNDTFNLFRIDDDVYGSFSFAKIVILKIARPYSNCLLSANEFICKNNCIRNKQRLSKYYFPPNETGLIHLEYKNNRTIFHNERSCARLCQTSENCRISYVYNLYDDKEIYIILKAYILINKLNLCIQCIGLILLFLNLSLYHLLKKLIKKLSKKINFIKKYLFIFQTKIFILNFIILNLLYFELINGYLNRRDNPVKKYIIINDAHFTSKPTFVFCLTFDHLMGIEIMPANLTYTEIEERTSNKFDKTKIDIFLKFQHQKTKLSWGFVNSEVMFQGCYRCFHAHITFPSKKYEYLMARSYLDLLINPSYDTFSFHVFILKENEKFNMESYRIESQYSFRKNIIRRSKANKKRKCIDYQKNFGKSRDELIEKCMFELGFKSKKISSQLVIYKNTQLFSQLNFSMLCMPRDGSNSKCINIHNEQLNKCKKNYPNLECTEVKFKKHIKIRGQDIFENYETDLHHDVISEIEEEPSILRLFIDLIGIQVILFDLNAVKILSIIFSLLKIRIKFLKSIIRIICLIGFSIHLFYSLNKILNGNLIYNQYQDIMRTIKISELHFCLWFPRENADPNYEFNIEKLNKLTDNMTINKVFEKVAYLNEDNFWVELNNETNFQSDALEIRFHYYFAFKCFVFKLRMEYDKEQFEFGDENYVFRISFNRTLIDQLSDQVLFFTKMDHFVSNKIYLNLRNRDYYLESNMVTQEIFNFKFDDRFFIVKKIIKKFFGLFYESKLLSRDEYLSKMIHSLERRAKKPKTFKQLFSEMSLETESVFIDKLYDYAKGILDARDASIPDTNTKKFFNNFLNIRKLDDDSINDDFVFSCSFFSRNLEIINEENFAKVIINWMGVNKKFY